MLPLLLALACAGEPPVALPPPQRQAPAVEARMVRMGAVSGWLARPAQPAAAQLPGHLLLVEQIDEAARAEAERLATAGAVVLCVEPAIDAEAARRYLDGMPAVAAVEATCRRATCP